jgi:hypothetical protein
MAKTHRSQLLEFFYSHVQPEEESYILLSMVLGDIEIFKRNHILALTNNFYFLAGLAGRIDILALRVHQFPWPAITAAIINNQMDLIMWILLSTPEMQLEQNKKELLLLVAQCGKLELLKFLSSFYSENFVWTQDVLNNAAMNGHVHILEYSWENDIPIDLEEICSVTLFGNINDDQALAILKWVRTKTPDHNLLTFSGVLVPSAIQGWHKILRWLLVHGYMEAKYETDIIANLGDSKYGKINTQEFQILKHLLLS